MTVVARRVPVQKAAERNAEKWLNAGLPKGHGLAPVRTMAGQMVALGERLLELLGRQRERYARYVEEHPPALAPIHKDATRDLPPETVETYHSWLESVALRREWWRDPEARFELDRAELSAAMREALEEAVGTGAMGARRALGALEPGFLSLGQREARSVLKDIGPYGASTNPEARAIYQAIADRAAGEAARAAVLRDGAGRLLGAVSYRTAGDVLDVGHLGALDGAAPGTGVQLVRELAAVAQKEGKGLALTAPAEAESFFTSLGFERDPIAGTLRLSAANAGRLVSDPDSLGQRWIRVGWLEGPDRARVRALAQQAASRGEGLAIDAAPGAGSVFERLGMTRAGNTFRFTAEQTAAFASGLTGPTTFGGQLTWELAVAGASDWLQDVKIPQVVDEVTETTHQALVDALAYGLDRGENTQQLAYRVRHLDNVFGRVRAERIARTEVITANRHGGYQIGKEAGCKEHEWRARVESPRTREWHYNVHRQRVPYGEPYTVPNRKGKPDKLLYPGDSSLGASADNVIQCRCSERRIKPGVTDDETLGINEHDLADGPAAPGPVVAGVKVWVSGGEEAKP